MKKYIIVLLILLLSTLCYAAIDTFEGETITDANNIEGCTTCDTIEGQVKKAAAVCTDPAGDIASEGFEGVGYELGGAWAESGAAPNEDYVLSGLSGGAGASQNCSTGLYTANVGAGSRGVLTTAGQSNWYVEFSFYVDSEGLASGNNIPIYYSHTGTITEQIATVNVSDVSGVLKVYGSGVGNSSIVTISLDTWYYVWLHVVDNGTCAITVGTTYGGTEILNASEFTDYDEDAQTTHFCGTYGANTISVVYGYFNIDDDGTF